MTLAHAMTLREARDRYLADAGLGVDTYVDDWVDIQIGPLPLRLPNTEGRKRVLPLHDVHHALTGYQADIRGEAEIAAWELGSGLGRHTVGYVLDQLLLPWTTLLAPRRVFRAFVRGRRSDSFYREPLPLPDATLEEDVDVVRRRLGLHREPGPATVADGLAFAGWYLASLLMSVPGLLSVPVMLALGLWTRWRRPPAQGAASRSVTPTP